MCENVGNIPDLNVDRLAKRGLVEKLLDFANLASIEFLEGDSKLDEPKGQTFAPSRPWLVLDASLKKHLLHVQKFSRVLAP